MRQEDFHRRVSRQAIFSLAMAGAVGMAANYMAANYLKPVPKCISIKNTIKEVVMSLRRAFKIANEAAATTVAAACTLGIVYAGALACGKAEQYSACFSSFRNPENKPCRDIKPPLVSVGGLMQRMNIFPR